MAMKPADTFLTTGAPRVASSSAVLFMIGLVAVALNQSGRVLGVNLSVADPLLVLAVLVMLIDQRLRFPGRIIAFFLLLSLTTVTTALLVTPQVFGIIPEEPNIALDLVKLATSLLFLILGYNVASRGIALHAIRWFAIGASLVATMGIALAFLNIHSFDADLYYSFVRYRGLMIDPNYYAVLSCAAIAYFLRDRTLKPILRITAVCVLVYSIVLSGSKTGTVALLVLLALLVLDSARRSKYSLVIIAGLTTASALLIALWDEIGSSVAALAFEYGGAVPQLYRIAELFSGDIAAAAGGGSDRLNVWARGIDIVETSPVVGAGIGSYGNVVEATSGIGTLAHNTYIQIAAEWGLPLAMTLFAWIGVLLLRANSIHRPLPAEAVYLRDVIIVFLVGSVSLSLNNARMFWFFLGALAFAVLGVREKSPSVEMACTREDR